MDDGETIAGLNEGWTLGGARVMEWVSGFVMAMISTELLQLKMGTSGPLMAVVLIMTTFSLAALRRQFPDEERGIRNAAMVGLGFEPPGIPSPAAFKPYWSGAPLRSLPEKSYFVSLNLSDLFDETIEKDLGSIFLKANVKRDSSAEAGSQGGKNAPQDEKGGAE